MSRTRYGRQYMRELVMCRDRFQAADLVRAWACACTADIAHVGQAADHVETIRKAHRVACELEADYWGPGDHPWRAILRDAGYPAPEPEPVSDVYPVPDESECPPPGTRTAEFFERRATVFASRNEFGHAAEFIALAQRVTP